LLLDPTCGIGDLLVAYATTLRVERDLAQTLSTWSKKLAGFDLQPQFIEVTKMRLMLAAMRAQGNFGTRKAPDLDELFPKIYVASTFDQSEVIAKSSYIIMNPPFGYMNAPEECSWAQGKVSSAAFFLDYVVSHSTQGTKVVAILPDVLRAGKRYEAWREELLSRVTVKTTKIIGQFDPWTDVDVFLLRLEVGRNTSRRTNWGRPIRFMKRKTVGDYFDVRVGPVVPYRDHKIGTDHRYIHAKILPPWKSVSRTIETRKYGKIVFTPPFVVVRRTSRPGDKFRAIGTIISGSRTVAVENHLIILEPKSPTVKSCWELIKILKDNKTSAWLDKRIRCRHLSVASISEIPWWKE